MTRPSPREGRIALVALAYMAIAMFACVLDTHVEELREKIVLGGCGLLAILDTLARTRDLFSAKRRVATTAALFAGTAAMAGIVSLLAAPSAAAAWHAVGHYLAAPLWLVCCWMAAPLLQSVAERESTPRVFLWFGAITFAFGAWCFVSVFVSPRPGESARAFVHDAGVWVPHVLFWLHFGRLRPATTTWLTRIAAATLVAGALLGAATGAVYSLANDDVRAQMADDDRWEDELVRVEFNPRTETGGWRLCFPFGHHNRMGLFAALAAVTLALGASVPGLRAGWRVVFIVAAILAVADLAMTMNRGAILALVAGGIVGVLARWGARALLVVIPGAIAVVLMLPTSARLQVRSLFERDTYLAKDSTVVTRFEHWRLAGEVITHHPVLGVGYGDENSATEQYALAQRLGITIRANHAHNVWLQVASESGVPAAMLLLGLTAFRWSFLAGAWRSACRRGDQRARAILAIWIAFEVAWFVFAGGNHPLRRSLGLMTWVAWTLAFLAAAESHSDSAE